MWGREIKTASTFIKLFLHLGRFPACRVAFIRPKPRWDWKRNTGESWGFNGFGKRHKADQKLTDLKRETSSWTVHDAHLSMYAIIDHFSLFAGMQSLWMGLERFLDSLYPWCWSAVHIARILNSVVRARSAEWSLWRRIWIYFITSDIHSEKHVSCLCVFVDFLLLEMCLVCWVCLFVLVCVSVRVFVWVCVCVWV